MLGKKGFQKGNKLGEARKGIRTRAKEIAWEVNENGCWVCTSHKPNTWGYPQCRINYKFKMISHIMYEKYKSEIPQGMHMLHTCDNPICINPDHLFVGTHQENMKDKVNKNRQSHVGSPGMHGTKHPQSILTEEQVLEIRAYTGITDKQIAERYGVSVVNINNIRNRKIWTHI